MARVKVVLKDSVEKLGQAGDIATVAAGYARNYLIPRGLAVPATKGNVQQAEHWKRSRVDRVSRERSAAEETKSRLESAPLRVTAQAGPDGRLFGSITPAHLAEAAATTFGVQIDRHVVHLDEPIRHLGMHEVHVRLHAEVTASVTVEVVEA